MIPPMAETTLTTENASRRVEVNDLVALLIEPDQVTVLVADLPVMSYRPDDRETLKCVAAQLLENSLVTMAQAVAAFGLPRSTLRDARDNFRERGVKGLVPNQRGPKGAWKLVTRARRLLLDTFYAHPDWKLPQITDHVNRQLQRENLRPLSQQQFRRFLKFCGLLPRSQKEELPSTDASPDSESGVETEGPEGVELTEEAAMAQAESQEQPFGFEPGVETGVPGRIEPVEERAVGQIQANDPLPMPAAEAAEESATPLTAADLHYLARLRQGIDTAFGGGFLVVPFLSLVQFSSLIARALPGAPEGCYTVLQVALTFFYLALFGVSTLETVKGLVKGDFGPLLGRHRSPGLTKLRAFLKAVGKLGRAEALALIVACQLIQAGRVEWQILYIDGHFIPYYGGYAIRKGYFTTHRMAIKGNEAYYANDRQGRPLFFLLGPASLSLIVALPQVVTKVKQIVGEEWVDWCLTLIFDRGGFCAALFKKLDEMKVHWVTWLKASCKVWDLINQLEEEMFQLCLLRLKNSKVKVKLCELGLNIKGYGFCRAIVLLDLQTGKRMVIITSDKARPAREVAQLMLGRWSQENFFKLMMARYYLDYSPGYQFQPLEQEPLVDNPRIKELRQLKKRLQTMKRKLESELGQQLLKRKRDNVALKDYKASHHRRVRAVEGLAREIDRLNQELSQTPKKVFLSQTMSQKPEECNFERKAFFDVMKELAFHAEEWLLERLAVRYQGKDVRQALLRILFRGAVVQLVGDVLYVWLKPFDGHQLQAAAEDLCHELNTLQPHTLDKFRFPIVYEVLPRPL